MAIKTRKTANTTILPPAISTFMRKRGQEFIGVLLFLSGIYVLLTLVSYNQSDPSFNTAVDGAVQNFGGHHGAKLADILMQSFGIASITLVFILFSWSRLKFIHRPLNRLWFKVALLPIILALISLSLSTLLPNSGSGAIGQLLLQKLKSLIAILGYPGTPQLLGLIAISSTIPVLVYVSGIRGYELSIMSATILRFIHNSFRLVATCIVYVLSKIVRKSLQVNTRRPIREKRARVLDKIDTPIEATTPKPPAACEEESIPIDLSYSGKYQLPPLDLLSPPTKQSRKAAVDSASLTSKAQTLMGVLEEFGIKGRIIKVNPGPVVTLYELVPAPGIKSSRVIGLADDIARSMSAISARVAIIPGQNALGIELPNEKRQTVDLRTLFASKDYKKSPDALTFALGHDIAGAPIMADLARMPHLLVAGTTGSGKSVAINSMILSLLYRLSPEHCKLIMIDPKMLELSVYDDIPHLLTPVVTDPKKAVVALKWAVREMENRYRAMSQVGVRNIIGYNMRIQEAKSKGEAISRQVQTGFDPDSGKPIYETQTLALEALPYIVIIVDEMADLMLVAGKDIESAVQRLAQMARAAGIHLVMATQRPSVDVITGTIKANFPTRISFQVSSKIDSRTILGEQGAEQLLGHGDMLYMAPGGRVTRIHGPFVSDGEVEKIVNFLKTQGNPLYIEEITQDDESSLGNESQESSGDELYDRAVAIVCSERKASTSFIQRKLQIGYNRAARIMDQMEEQGVVSPANHVGKREVLAGSH